VEQEVTKKIEQYLFSFEEVKKRKNKIWNKRGTNFYYRRNEYGGKGP
jgi:hypothetical protein